MIGAASQGGGFRALGSYLVEKEPGRVEWIEARNTTFEDPREVVAEMEAWAAQSDRVKHPMYHVAISFDPDDHPTDAEIRASVDRTLTDLGLDKHQALVVRHNDTDHEHVHIMVNRVGEDGKAWSKSNDHHKLRASMEAQERELGVRWTGRNAERVAQAERVFERSGDRPAVRELIGREPAPSASGRARDRGFAAEVRSSSLDDFKRASSWSDLEARLAARGLTIERRGQGAVVTDGDREAKLSSVSRSVSRGKLEGRLGSLRERAPSQSVGRLAAPAATPKAAGPLLSRRRSAVVGGKIGRQLQPVSLRGAAGRAIRGGELDPDTRAAQKTGRLAFGVVRTSLASRRAVAAHSPTQQGMPEGRMTQGRLRGLVRARETARVERVVALVGRAHAYERAAAALGTVTRYEGRVNGAVWLSRQAGEKTQALDVHLRGIYERPVEARARILGYAEHTGPAKVSQLLAREPERFGRLVATPEAPARPRLGKLLSKPAPSPDHAAALARRVQEAGPLVASAHQTRTQAAEAVRSLGLRTGSAGRIKGPELSQAVERRAGRLRGAAERGMGRVPGTGAASAQLSRAVRGLTPGQQARVVSRVGQVGLGTVSRSLSVAKALVRGVER